LIPQIKIKEKNIGIIKEALCASIFETRDINAPIIWLAG
jgi:hypothetical protein